MTRRHWLAIAATAGVLSAAAVWFHPWQNPAGDRVYTIGWEENAPNQVRAPDGRPTGFAVDPKTQILRPEDLAEVIVLAATNGYMTGAVLTCDGGGRWVNG